MAPIIRASGMKPAKVPNDRFEYRRQSDGCFLRRIERTRGSLRAGHETRREDVEDIEAE